MFLRNEANKSFVCNKTSGQEAPRDDVQPGLHQLRKRSSPPCVALLFPSAQIARGYYLTLSECGEYKKNTDRPASPGGKRSEEGSQAAMERRRHKRVLLGVPAQCQSVQLSVEVRAENVSINGLLVRATKTFPEDKEITVSFVLPGSTQAIRSRARVTHVVPDMFMGLEFLDLTPESKEQIEQYIAAQSVPGARQG